MLFELVRQSIETHSSVHREDEDHEEEREVAGSIVLHEHEDKAANEHDGHRVDEEPEALAETITRQGVEKRPDDHEDVRRRSEQEVDDVVVVIEGCFCQCREEVLESMRIG